MRLSLEWEVRGSYLGPVKSGTVFPTAYHRCDISLKNAVLPWRNDAEMCLTNLLHALAYYSKYNEKFDLSHSGSIFSIYYLDSTYRRSRVYRMEKRYAPYY